MQQIQTNGEYYKDIFAELVYLAIDKGYIPDEVRENPYDFERAYEEFFGRSVKFFE